jgi:hypothetical protein
MSDSRRGIGLDIGFIDHFNTQLQIPLNYSVITDFHILQITSAHAKSFPARNVFTGSCLATASSHDYSSASGLESFLNSDCLPTASSCQSQSQSYFTTGGLPPISSSWRRAPWDSRPDFCSQLNTFGQSLYIISSLTRGRTCCLKWMLALASAVILGFESRGTRDHILLSQILDFPFYRLLLLAGLRWRYRTPPPHGNSASSCFSCPPYNPLSRTVETIPLLLYAYPLSRERVYRAVAWKRLYTLQYVYTIR